MNDTMQIISATVEVPPGEYWVGDPCYIVTDLAWEEALLSSRMFTLPIGVTGGGAQVLAFHTHHGDGVYHDKQGREYPVDAGVIGLVPVEGFPEPADGLMHKIEFEQPAVCFTEDGIIFLGHLSIDTDPHAAAPKKREEFIRRGGMVTWGKPKQEAIEEAPFVEEAEDQDDDS
jgi:hypothetical protein